jgi:hypothetical protein
MPRPLRANSVALAAGHSGHAVGSAVHCSTMQAFHCDPEPHHNLLLYSLLAGVLVWSWWVTYVMADLLLAVTGRRLPLNLEVQILAWNLEGDFGQSTHCHKQMYCLCNLQC